MITIQHGPACDWGYSPDDTCTCGAIAQLAAVEALIAIVRVVVPLAASAQRERMILGARTMDLLNDMLYSLSSNPDAKENCTSWVSAVYGIFFDKGST